MTCAATVITMRRLIARAFEGKTRVQQHQMVYAALQGRMGNELHAPALQTSAPEDVQASSGAILNKKGLDMSDNPV